MPALTLKVLAVLSFATQLAEAPILRVGKAAQELSVEELTNVLRIAEPDSSKTWLVVSSNTAAGQAALDLFLRPTTTTPQIRRGRMVSLSRGPGWALNAATPTGDYAQVAVPDRGFEEIKDDLDQNLPFRVSGRFEDKEIVDIVTDARWRALPGVGRGPRPIRTLVRDASDTVRVDVRNLGSIIYRREPGAWVFRYVQNVAI